MQTVEMTLAAFSSERPKSVKTNESELTEKKGKEQQEWSHQTGRRSGEKTNACGRCAEEHNKRTPKGRRHDDDDAAAPHGDDENGRSERIVPCSSLPPLARLT